MKFTLSFFIILFCFNTTVKAQYILAGSYGESDYYFDVTPDFVLINGGDNNTNGNKYPIDLNGDGTVDISITGYIVGWNYRIGDISVIAEDHCKVAFERIDTISPSYTEGECIGKTDKYFNLAHCFSPLDTINNSITWSDSIRSYIRYDYLQGCYPRSSNNLTAGIIGVQLKAGSDTLYGWVKLSNMVLAPFDGAFVTIEEYACTLPVNNGIDDLKLLVEISPNPCKDILNVNLINRYNKGLFSLSDIQGKEIYRKQINSSNFVIDISDLPAGIYIYNYSDKKWNKSGKLIKE